MVFTEVGKIESVKLITGDSSTHLNSTNTRLAFGDGTTNATENDTTLGNELNRYKVDGVTRSAKTVKFSYTLSAAQLNGNDIKEIGLLDASTSGNLYSRTNIATVSKTAGIEIEIDYTLELQ